MALKDYGRIRRRGFYQNDLIYQCELLISEFNELLIKLDADSGVSGTNYSSLYAITEDLGTAYNDDSQGQGYWQGRLVTRLKSLHENFEDTLTKLDADGGVTDTDYASLWGMAAANKPRLEVGSPGSRIQKLGWHDGDLVDFLDNYIRLN